MAFRSATEMLLATKLLYGLHDLARAMLGPTTHLAWAGTWMFSAPGSWLSQLPGASSLAASYELLYRLGRTYEKPAFGIESVEVRGDRVTVTEQAVLAKPFCQLRRFQRQGDRADVAAALRGHPTVLVVAPLAGHHATLLRDTVRTLLVDHEVYVTDWVDARTVPLTEGAFSLDDYVRYLREFIGHIGAERLHLMSVCQAAVPSLAAVALMATAGELLPRSLIMMGGPIDSRRSPTTVNQLAIGKPLAWFESHLIHQVPIGHAGRGRRVYPGFLQHASFMAMNPIRHLKSHWEFYQHLIRGDLSDAAEHRRFYDEYNAVVDLAAEYYLDCIDVVFQRHLLPRGLWQVGGQRVAPDAIADTSLLTIEGQLDDISGLGQTQAAHDLCSGISSQRKYHMTVAGAGHYGIFSGRRWREIVYPRLRQFIASAST